MTKREPPELISLGDKDAEPSPELLGLKGAGLVTMLKLGLPVPPGFVLSTRLTERFISALGSSPESAFELPRELGAEVLQAVAALSAAWKKDQPLRLAVRSSPTVSMPGMMDTILDISAADPRELFLSIISVLRSAFSPRVLDYRRLTATGGDSGDFGVAVVVQAMVYGNRTERSATGVLFTRDPSTGEPALYGEFLPRAQGQELVSGSTIPRPLAELKSLLPDCFSALIDCGRRLENHFGDMQDIEFTVEDGTLWLLQTRTGKRSGRAMVRIAVDLFTEGRIEKSAALLRLEPRRLGELLRPAVSASASRTLLVRGLPASPGAACGKAVFSTADVESLARAGERAILVRTDTSPSDIRGIRLAAGLLTARGGMTSHAAVVARGLGRCAVVGASALQINAARQMMTTREHVVKRGELLTLDGNSGEVLLGEVALSAAHLRGDAYLQKLLEFSAARRLRVYALADSESESQLGSENLADGVLRRRPLTLTAMAEPTAARRFLEIADSFTFAAAKRGARLPDVVLLSFDLEEELGDAVRFVREARPDAHLGLAATALRSDEVELVARASELALDFVACPPLRTVIASVAAAQLIASAG